MKREKVSRDTGNQVLVIATYLSKGTAAYRRIRYFMDYLLNNGYILRCVSPALLTNYGIAMPLQNCISYPFPLISSNSLVAMILNTILMLPMTLYILVLKPKIVLLSVPDYSTLLPSLVGSKLVKSKLIVDIRDPPEVSFYKILIKRGSNKVLSILIKLLCRIYYTLVSKVHIILAVTETLKNSLVKMSIKNVIVVPNGADLSIFKGHDKLESRRLLGIYENSFVIIYTGMIGGYHDLSKFIALLSKLNNQSGYNIKMLLAGPIVDQIHKSLIETNKVEGIVTYLGILDTKKLIIALSASDVGIVPLMSSDVFNYAIPVKFYEYIAISLPVLALCSEGSELWRVVRDNNLGFACRPEDLICFERSLRTLMSKDVYLKVKANVEKYRGKVDRTLGAKILLAIIKSLLHKG